MSRLEEMGQREELRTRRKIIAAEITSHCDSIRHALPLVGEPTVNTSWPWASRSTSACRSCGA